MFRVLFFLILNLWLKNLVSALSYIYHEYIEAATKWPPFSRRHFQMYFLKENVWISIEIPLMFVPEGPIDNISSGDKPLSEPMMVSLQTHISVTRPQWVKENITCIHYDDVIMGVMASQITSLTIVYSTVYSGTDQRKHQSSASLAFVWRIHRGPVNSTHKWPATRKMFPFDDVIMLVKSVIVYIMSVLWV